MTDDHELLRRYACDRDEAAFGELVRRHVNLVHSAAARQVNGDAHLAQDVAQRVFADLARKAGSLTREQVLAGWLFVSTRHAAAHAVRGEQRRRVREQEAHMREELAKDELTAAQWERVRPVLDEAMSELGATDREAILLRFFEGCGFTEVGARLRLNENSARMRVERALDKLHRLLARRGVTSTTGALAMALANQAVVAAPAGLAASVTGAALAGAAATGSAAAVASFMSMTKLQLGLTGAIAVAGATGWIVQADTADAVRQEVAALRGAQDAEAQARADNLRLRKAAAEADRERAEAADGARWQAQAMALEDQLAQREREAAAAQAVRREAGQAAARGRVAAALQAAAQTGDRLPQPTARVVPKYPAALREVGLPGEVVVSFVVDAEGNVVDAVAAKSTRPEFEDAAVEAVEQWKFEPGVKGHRPVNTRLEQVITFTGPESDGQAGELKPVDNVDWIGRR